MDDEAMTDDELAAIEARCAAATAGPWKAWIEGRDHFAGDDVIITSAGTDIYVVPPPHRPPDADLDFIAAARQDISRLIAEVRRLRQLVGDANPTG
jgi:hypothetical protein